MLSLKSLSNILRYGVGPRAREKKRAAKRAQKQARFESDLWEKDEEELLGYWDPLPPLFAGIGTLSEWEVSNPLKPTGPGPPPNIPFIQFSDDGNADDADYFYYWYYKRCHLETEPVCHNP